MAAWNASQAFCQGRHKVTVLFWIDNTSAVAYINHMGETRSSSLAMIAIEFDLDMGSTTGGNSQGSSYHWRREPGSRQNVEADDERQNGLAAQPQDLCQNYQTVWTFAGGYVCNEAVYSTLSIFLLEARTPSSGHRCFSSRLVTASRLCQPTVVPNSAMYKEGNTAGSYPGPGHTSLDHSELVSNGDGSVYGLLSSAAPVTRPPTSDSQHRNPLSQSTNSIGCMAHLGQCLKEKGISELAEGLIAAAWRDFTSKNYDSVWRKLEKWCIGKHTNPISAPIYRVCALLTDNSVPQWASVQIIKHQPFCYLINTSQDRWLCGRQSPSGE